MKKMANQPNWTKWTSNTNFIALNPYFVKSQSLSHHMVSYIFTSQLWSNVRIFCVKSRVPFSDVVVGFLCIVADFKEEIVQSSMWMWLFIIFMCILYTVQHVYCWRLIEVGFIKVPHWLGFDNIRYKLIIERNGMYIYNG